MKDMVDGNLSVYETGLYFPRLPDEIFMKIDFILEDV
jgi:hypothetical protein